MTRYVAIVGLVLGMALTNVGTQEAEAQRGRRVWPGVRYYNPGYNRYRGDFRRGRSYYNFNRYDRYRSTYYGRRGRGYYPNYYRGFGGYPYGVYQQPQIRFGLGNRYGGFDVVIPLD